MSSQLGSAPVKMDRYKTKLCLFHLQGRCCKGLCSPPSVRVCVCVRAVVCSCVG